MSAPARFDFDEKAMIGLLLLLGLIALALITITTLMYLQFRASETERALRPPTEIGTREMAEDGAANALAKLLAERGMPKDEADRLANLASRMLLQDIARDQSGETARKFDEWTRASNAPSGAANAKEKSAAVWPYVESALKRATQALGLSAKSAGILASLSADALGEIGKGFFGGLGGLPWELIKDWMTRRPDNERPIVVNCSACADKEAKNGQPIGPCPTTSLGTTTCPKAVVLEVEIEFAPDQYRLVTPSQRERIDIATRHALSFPDTTVILWAYTDTTSSEDHNQRLARQRASEVRSALVNARVPIERIRVAPMGEYNVPVHTEDNVPEARNRIVKVEVRSTAQPVPAR